MTGPHPDGDLRELVAGLETSPGVRRKLDGGGRIHIDRPLPFLVVYRPPDGHDAGTSELVSTQPAYLIAPTGRGAPQRTAALVSELIEAMRPMFGPFLLVEVTAGVGDPASDQADVTISASDTDIARDLLGVLERRLRGVKRQGRALTVEVASHRPGGRRALFTVARARELDCHRLAIVVHTPFRAEDRETVFPAVLRHLRKGLGQALVHTFYRFAERHTSAHPASVHALGRQRMVRAAWLVDEQLATVSRSFDFLLSINPVGVDACWAEFRSERYDRLPRLRYRPLTIDPVLMKRTLYNVPVEAIEDPSLSQLFYEKQAELDRQLTMLNDRGTSRFLHGSVQLHGAVDARLMRSAEEILERVPATLRGPRGGHVGSSKMLELANAELDWYRRKWSGFTAGARISSDVLAGMMCSRGQLLVSENTRTPESRVDALIQHEVGTHLVTWFNGGAQRLQHLQVGLAGYEQLQEGLAVFAEFAVGGMTPARLRTLAARVIAAHGLVDGGSFVDVFRMLCRYGFTRRASFNVTLRIFRGGGYTKDLIYLRGLIELLGYLEEGGELAPLFVGKIGMRHLPMLDELTSRGVVVEAPLLPRYLARPECQTQIARARRGMSPSDMLDSEGRA